jgi:uncharacterized lipoprotein YbaY
MMFVVLCVKQQQNINSPPHPQNANIVIPSQTIRSHGQVVIIFHIRLNDMHIFIPYKVLIFV